VINIRVKTVKLYHVVMKLKTPFETSFGKTIDRHCVLVEIVDEEGDVGWGEIPVDDVPYYHYETVETTLYIAKEFLIPKLLKTDIIEPEDFLNATSRIRGYVMAKAGFEMTLWDLLARKKRKPLYELIGGTKGRIVSGVSIGIIGNTELLLKSVSRFLNEGYRRIKIKIKPKWDIEPVKTIRKIFGNIPLQVDANAAYTLKNINVFKQLDRYNLLMIEQPLHYEDLAEHAELQSKIRTPICLDESIKSIYDAKAAIKLGSCKIINIKPARVGGLSESIAIHNHALEHNVPVWIGGMLETGIGRGFQVALATLPNIKYPNDISASNRYYEEDIVEPPWLLNSDGTIAVPKKPGIGVEVLVDKIEKYSRKIIEFKSHV